MYKGSKAKKAYNKFARIGMLQIVILVAASLLVAATPTITLATADNRLIVQLKAGQSLSSFNQAYGTSTVQTLSGSNTYLLNPPAGQSAATLVGQLQSDTRLVYSETNSSASKMQSNPSGVYYDPSGVYYDPSGVYYDPYTQSTKTVTTPRQYAFDHIRLNLAHQRSKGAGVTIAVVDSGIYVGHPLLAGRITTQRYNAIDNSSNVTDVSGHGTFVAGILAQVAPQAMIMPVKVLANDGYGEVADAAEGIRWAADHGAKIINVSLGTYYDEAVLRSAVIYAREVKGALVVASVGNDSSSNQRYPASYANNGTNTLSVGATGADKKKASFSNYGDNSAIRVVAPGTQIRSLSKDGGFVTGQGTSFSTPIVAGVAALYWSIDSSKTADDIKSQVESKTFNLDKCDTTYGANYLGKGMIDAFWIVGGEERQGQ